MLACPHLILAALLVFSTCDQSQPAKSKLDLTQLVKPQTGGDAPRAHSKRDVTNEPSADKARLHALNRVVRQAFLATHDGWSTDEVLLNDLLNRHFLEHCRQALPAAQARECNWTLLNLRKAGRLGSVVTKRRTSRHDDVLHVAEIAARHMYDKYALTMDRVLCDPAHRAVFDRIASSIAGENKDKKKNGSATLDLAYRVRKAALGLRKSRRLRPELVLRVADWGQQVLTFSAEQIVKDPQRVPANPGVYIFRDESGYLYIGESKQLRSRVLKHLDRSDRKSLSAYLSRRGIQSVQIELHVFNPESNAKDKAARRAYESELIRSRKPRLNIQP